MSNAIKTIAYDSGTLVVTRMNGEREMFHNVPQTVADEFGRAEYPERYMAYIRKQYGAVKNAS